MNAPPAIGLRKPSPLRSIGSVLAVLGIDAALLAFALGGWRTLLREPRALALLGIWAAANLALSLWRPVRGQDTVVSRRDLPVMLALFLLPMLTPPLAAWGGRHALWILPQAAVVSWFGVGLVALGMVLRVAAMRTLGRRFSPLVAVQRGHALETRGLYGLVRHPGYLGALLACFGAALAFGSALALPLAAFMLVCESLRIRGEEALLREHFGADWDAYARRTGALLPRPGHRA